MRGNFILILLALVTVIYFAITLFAKLEDSLEKQRADRAEFLCINHGGVKATFEWSVLCNDGTLFKGMYE